MYYMTNMMALNNNDSLGDIHSRLPLEMFLVWAFQWLKHLYLMLYLMKLQKEMYPASAKKATQKEKIFQK